MALSPRVVVMRGIVILDGEGAKRRVRLAAESDRPSPPSVMAGRQVRPPKHTVPTVAVLSIATRRPMFLDRRDLCPAKTEKAGQLSRETPRPATPARPD